jgi:DNA-binding response OmpR family regulator
MADDKPLRVLYVACRRGRTRETSPQEHLHTLVDAYVRRMGLPAIEWILVNNQKAALAIARSETPRMAIVELDMEGGRLQFCEALRYRLPSLRVLTVGGEAPGAGSPCDLHLPVPLQEKVVDAMLLVALDGHSHATLQRGPIRLNVDERSVVTPKGQYHMTPKTTQLLLYLMQHHAEVLSRREIMQNVWETTYLEDTRTLDVHIRWLRERIEIDPSEPRYLVTVRGRGYRLQLD